jgi:hydroxypyruvate isomerase
LREVSHKSIRKLRFYIFHFQFVDGNLARKHTEASFSHLPLSDFEEVSRESIRKLHFHIFHFHRL